MFPAIFTKGKNFCDFLCASLDDKTNSKSVGFVEIQEFG